jgi:hypothetical protein
MSGINLGVVGIWQDEIRDLGPLRASCRLYFISNITLLRVAIFVDHV